MSPQTDQANRSSLVDDEEDTGAISFDVTSLGEHQGSIWYESRGVTDAVVLVDSEHLPSDEIGVMLTAVGTGSKCFGRVPI